MISIQNVTTSIGKRILFDDVNLHLNQKSRYGLVGANGAGKTTFMHLLAFEHEPLVGEITKPKNLKVCFLKQDQDLYLEETIISVVLRGKKDLWDAFEKKEKLLNQKELSNKDIEHLGELEERVMQLDGYAAESKAEGLLMGLGIPEKIHQNTLGSLSGGYKLRVLLARTLFNDPDALLLDEPTNYLDIVTIDWLSSYLLNEFQGLLVVISHDHHFLNNLCTHILDIDYGEVRSYTGNYDKFLVQKKEVELLKAQMRKHQEKYIERQKAFIEKFRYKPSKSKQAISREKQLDKLEWPKLDVSSRKHPNFSFSVDQKPGKFILKLDQLAKDFGEKKVLRPLDLKIYRGEKVAILGPNGVGKSTLLKLICQQLEPTSGSLELGQSVEISYFAQEFHENLSGKSTILEWLDDNTVNVTEEKLRAALGRMLFTQDDHHKTLNVLSGGEKARLVLAKIILDQKNLLILDEPTNHLDLEAREALAKALVKYKGTLIFVSHDQYFIEKISERIIYIQPDNVMDFEGTYSELKERFS